MDKKFKNFYKVIFFATILPSLNIIPFVPVSLGGFNLSGWAWIICLVASLFVISKASKLSFPFWIWIPWILYMLFSLIFDFSFVGLQLTLQYVVPIIVGIAASSFLYNESKLLYLFKQLRNVLFITSLIFSLRYLLGQKSMGADFVMFIVIMAALFLAIFFKLKKKTFLIYYGILCLFPLILLTRMGILMTLLIAPLHFALKNISTRIVFVIFLLLFGNLIFYSSAVQEKMFLSGSGTIEELISDKSKLNTSGRENLAFLMEYGLRDNPVWGNGPRADLLVFNKNDLGITEAHNDYLSIRYNYGWVGLVLLLLSIFLQFFKVFVTGYKRLDSYTFIIRATILTLFIPLFGFMYSDNILKYSTIFGNYHFALMGIFFSIIKSKRAIHNFIKI